MKVDLNLVLEKLGESVSLLGVITYGSHLYGTSSEKSDFDFKGVYLPALDQCLLCETPRVIRYRYHQDGRPVGDHETMPANGWEAELVPVVKFVQDYCTGQAYAVEMAFAFANDLCLGTTDARLKDLCQELCTTHWHTNVKGMVGFAVKQTFDYVHRGERYNAALDVLAALDAIRSEHASSWTGDTTPVLRLDSVWSDNPQQTVLDELVKRTGLETGLSANNNKTMRTLKLNGREYLDTTTLLHLYGAVQKLRDQYGERSILSSKTSVEWKSLSHAVRVYRQVIELLTDKKITFPRPDSAFLVQVKSGEVELETVKDLLRSLDAEVESLLTTIPEKRVDSRLDGALVWYLTSWYESSMKAATSTLVRGFFLN